MAIDPSSIVSALFMEICSNGLTILVNRVPKNSCEYDLYLPNNEPSIEDSSYSKYE